MAKRKTKLILNGVVSLVLFLAATIVLGKAILLADKVSIISSLLLCTGTIIRLWIFEKKERKKRREKNE
ncbi:hypothetical protein ACS127_12680 [Amphibacillus sp. Q70]|uniref:hypothetical protein n=1 Tax=Amphibacillus sp. Q70 TaxID=3453416 RepID=UPI003F86CFB2